MSTRSGADPGVPIETIADQLGHDGTRMTLLIYRHATKPTVNAGNAMAQHLSARATDSGLNRVQVNGERGELIRVTH